jgi:hypothetical protein
MGEKMRKVRTEHLFLPCLVLFLSAFVLPSCDECKLPDCCAECGLSETADISGKVVTLSDPPNPVAGATVGLVDGSRVTTSGEDGGWALEDVPDTGVDPWIKITAEGIADSYNSFPLSLVLGQYDLKVMEAASYEFLTSGYDPETRCLIFGVTVGFVSYEYPQETKSLEGVSVGVTPDTLEVKYANEIGLPDPTLTATSSSGVFYVVVPDANSIRRVSLTGTKTGSAFLSGDGPTWPNALVVRGVVDVNFTP